MKIFHHQNVLKKITETIKKIHIETLIKICFSQVDNDNFQILQKSYFKVVKGKKRSYK